MRRPAAVLLASPVLVLLAACGSGATDAAPTQSPTPTTAAATGSSAAASSGTTAGASTTPPPFRPTRAVATTEPWHLPYAAGRQAVVPTGAGQVLVAGGLLAGDQSTDRVVRVDLAQGKVRALPALAVPVHDVAGGLAGSTPLVVGGGNATEQDVVQAWRGHSWRVTGHLPTSRSDLSVVQHGTTPWVVGGYDGSGTPLTVLALAADGSSRLEGRLAEGVRYAATAVLGHTAYVFGGEVLGRELGDVQALDLSTGRTRVVARLPVPLGHAMAATLGGRILLVGGRVTPDRQTGAMWWFDPGTGRFTHAGRLPHRLSDAGVAAVGDTMWLLGGEDPTVTDGVLTISVH
ncbi:MAG: kelch repeat-containing protein [Nocardioides sp.]